MLDGPDQGPVELYAADEPSDETKHTSLLWRDELLSRLSLLDDGISLS